MEKRKVISIISIVINALLLVGLIIAFISFFTDSNYVSLGASNIDSIFDLSKGQTYIMKNVNASLRKYTCINLIITVFLVVLNLILSFKGKVSIVLAFVQAFLYEETQRANLYIFDSMQKNLSTVISCFVVISYVFVLVSIIGKFINRKRKSIKVDNPSNNSVC